MCTASLNYFQPVSFQVDPVPKLPVYVVSLYCKPSLGILGVIWAALKTNMAFQIRIHAFFLF